MLQTMHGKTIIPLTLIMHNYAINKGNYHVMLKKI